MKKRILTVLLGLFTVAIWAQDEDTKTPRSIDERVHELRLDATEILIIPTLEINYEYVLSKYSGLGVAASISFDDEEDFDNQQKFAITPFYRQYFFNKKDYGARGFFVEGMLQFASGDEDVNVITVVGESSNVTADGDWFNFGVGLALGQKWVSNNGFVFELSAGAGRYLVNEEFGPDAFFRGGVLVGYRF